MTSDTGIESMSEKEGASRISNIFLQICFCEMPFFISELLSQ